MDFRLSHVSLVRRHLQAPPRTILSDISLGITPGSCVGIIGREGSGKSTLLQVLAGLLPPTTGEVFIDAVNPWASEKNGVLLRRRLGVTFQFPEEQFLRPTVGREFGDLLGVRNVGRELQPGRMRDALETMGMDASGLEHRSPFTLSLGESRLVSIALALAVHPDGLLLDEPTAGLDARGIRKLHGALAAARKEGRTIVIATHDLDFLREGSDSVLVLDEGRITDGGLPGDVLAKRVLLERLGLLAGRSGFRL